MLDVSHRARSEVGVMGDDRVTDAVKEIDTARENSALENLKGSLDGWRSTLVMDNGLVFLINVICLGLGASVVMETTGLLVYVGAALAVIGGLGIADSVLGRVMA